MCCLREQEREGTGANCTKGPLRPFSFDRLSQDQSVLFVLFCFQRKLLEKNETSALNHAHRDTYMELRTEEGRNIRVPLWKNSDH